MCGIVGYVGPRPSQDILIAGLARLEYRGYDSAGIAVIDGDGHLGMRKKAGKLSMLRDSLADAPLGDGTTGIGHTRWATHGGPTDLNAHPHLADDGKLAVIHNGIIENFAPLRDELAASGVEFLSETDTEVAAALLGREYAKSGDLQAAFRAVVNRLEGAFTLLATHQDHPGLVVGARRNSPLVIGLGEGENFLGSDVAAFVEHTRKALAIGQDQIVAITPSEVTVTDFDGNVVEAEPFEVSWDAAAAEKGGWSSFMAKEVAEQPEAVANTIRGRVQDGQVVIPELDGLDELFVGINRVIITACGTASYAALVGKYAIEQWARVATDVELAHEFRYRDPVIGDDTLVISISQSGETMDTLMAVKYARERGARTLSICNTQGATIPRESDAVVYTHAGPEVAVASTKAFSAQITALLLLGLHMGRVRSVLTDTEAVSELAVTAGEDRVSAREGERPRLAARQLDGRHPLGAVPRPPRRLPDRPRGCAEAQGDLVHPRRGIRRRRAQARPDRPHRARPAGVRDRAVAAPLGADPLQGRLEHPGDPRARRPRDRHRRRGGCRGAALRGRGHPHPARRPDVRAGAQRRSAADLRHGSGDRQGPGRGPAPQPRQVRHGRIRRTRAARLTLVGLDHGCQPRTRISADNCDLS